MSDFIYENIAKPLLFLSDAESAHNLVSDLLPAAAPFLPLMNWQYTNKFKAYIAGTALKNPIGLAAGFDKNAHLLPVLHLLGFGFAEIGSITAKASRGNAKPRLFRLPEDQALINRLGLNNDGADVIAERIRNSKSEIPIGINIAQTNDASITGDAAIEDILYSFTKVKDLSAAYITVNASCPNTKEGCMQEKEKLSSIFSEIKKLNTNKIPVFVKLSSDSTDSLLNDIVEIAATNNLAGYVCGNSTITRNNLVTNAEKIREIGNGGLTGKPLKQLALSLCKRVDKLKTKEQQIIAVGGITSGQDAFDFISAGASCLQIYTALIYHGPAVIKQICRQLDERLQKTTV